LSRLLALLLCLLPVLAIAQTASEERDRGYLVGLIEDNLSGVGRTVIVEGFAGALSSEATVDLLTIADGEGVWLRAEDLTLTWTRTALLRGALEVDALTAGRLEIIRPPIADPSLPAPEATPFSLPELPVSVRVGEFRIDTLVLGEALLGDPLEATISGEAELADGEGFVRLAGERTDGGVGALDLDGAYSNTTRVLSLDLDLREGPGGLVVTALGIPGEPDLEVTLAGTGPLDDFDASLLMRTDGEDRVTGRFGLTSVASDAGAEQNFRADVIGNLAPLLAPVYAPFVGTDARLAVQGRVDETGALFLPQLSLDTGALTLDGMIEVGADGWPRLIRLTGGLGSDGGEAIPLPGGSGNVTLGRGLLDVQYDAALGDDWTAALFARDLSLDGMEIPDITVTGTGQIAPNADRFAARLTYALSGIVAEDPGLATALGSEIAGALALSRQGDGPLRIEDLTLTGPGLEVDANGTIDGANRYETALTVELIADQIARFSALAGRDLGGAAQVTLDIDARPLDGAFAIGIDGVTTDLTVANDALDPLLAGQGVLDLAAVRDEAGTRLERLFIETPLLTANATANITSAASTADFDLAITDLAPAFEGLNGRADITGTAVLNTDESGTLSVVAALPGSRITLDADLDDPGSGGQVTLDLSGALSDIAPFSALAERDLAGSLRFALDGIAARDFSTFDLSTSVQSVDLALADDRIDPLLTDVVRASGRIIRIGPDHFRAEGLDLATATMSLRGTGTLDGNRVLAEGLTVNATTLAPLSGLAGRQLSGAVQATLDGSLVTDLSLIDLMLDARTNGLALGDARIDPLLAGRISLTGAVERTGATEGRITGLSLTGPNITAEGTVEAQDGTVTTSGLTLAIADLSAFSALANRPLDGQISATLSGEAQVDGSLFDLTTSVRSQDLEAGIPALDLLLAGPGRIDGRIERTGPLGGVIDDLEVVTSNLSARIAADFTQGAGTGSFDVSLSDAALFAPGFDGGAQVSGTVARDTGGVVSLDIDGRGAGGLLADLRAQLVSLSETDLTLWDVTLDGRVAAERLDTLSALAGRRLGGSLSADISGDLRTDLSRFDLTLDASAANLQAGIPAIAPLFRGQGTLDARLRRSDPSEVIVEGLRLAFPNLTVNADIDGATNGTGTARFDARLADLALFVPGFPGPVTASGTAGLRADGSWVVDAAATGPFGVTVNADGTVQPGGRFDLGITGSAPLGLANPFIEPRTLDGIANFDLRLDGPAALSSLSGTIRTSDARVSAPTLGEALTGIAATVTLNGAQAQIDLSGALRAGGRLTVAGPVALSAPFNGDLRVGLEGLVLRDPELYQTTATGVVTVAGPLSGGARIGGTITLGETDIRVPSSAVGGIGTLPEVRHVGAPGDVQATLARAGLTINGFEVSANGGGGAARPFVLDLVISAPSRVFIRGRGLDAELGGEIRIGGTTANVVPSGQIALLRGRLDLLQQRFDLTEGFASLAGDFVPVLRLIAVTETDSGTTVRIIVDGPANAPTVTFSSSPELPQDEVISLLLFGRDLSSISPLQAVQLASAIATLAGGGGGVLDRFRETTGLDDLDLATDDEGNTSFTAGKYLSENIYTDVTVGSAQTEVSINLDLTDDITARGSVDSDGNTSLGIFFERDY
jgi:translocation and assembly module TamB